MDSVLLHAELPSRARIRTLYGLHVVFSSLSMCLVFSFEVNSATFFDQGVQVVYYFLQSALCWFLTQRFLKLNRGWAAASIHSGIILLVSTVNVVRGTMTFEGSLRWLVLAVGTAAVAFGLFVTFQLSEGWDRATQSKRLEMEQKLIDAKNNGGTCPNCAGTGICPKSPLDRAFIALGAGMSSLGGQPVSSRTALREFQSKCPTCSGLGRFAPSEFANE